MNFDAEPPLGMSTVGTSTGNDGTGSDSTGTDNASTNGTGGEGSAEDATTGTGDASVDTLSIDNGPDGRDNGGMNTDMASSDCAMADAQPTDGAPTDGGSSACDPSGWRATASVFTDLHAPALAIDGDLTTRWSSGRFQDGTDWFQVDFGAPITLSTVTLNNTAAFPDDYPGTVEVYLSSDGKTFQGPIAQAHGAYKLTTIHFSRSATRAVRLRQTGSTRKNNWWQVGELQIDCGP